MRFRLCSYNLLAEIYATQQAYPYCDFWALSWGEPTKQPPPNLALDVWAYEGKPEWAAFVLGWSLFGVATLERACEGAGSPVPFVLFS